MDLEYVLGWLVGTSAPIGLAVTLHHYRTRVPGWLAIYGLVLAIVLLDVFTDLPYLGYVGAAVWGLLFVAPLTALKRAQEALKLGQRSRAVLYSRLGAALHPWDGVRDQTRFIRYESQVQAGKLDEARESLEPLRRSPLWAERVKLENLRLDDDWDAIVEHVNQQRVGTRDLRIAPLFLRALGQVGKLDAMWKVYGLLPRPIRALPSLQLQLVALTGLEDATASLLRHLSAQVTADEGEFWRAIAAQRAGDQAGAEARLRVLCTSTSGVAIPAGRRLERPLEPIPASSLSAATQAAIKDYREQLRGDLAAFPDPVASRSPRATWALEAVLFAVFLLSVPGGSEDIQNLIGLGALVLPPELVEGNVVWRVVLAGFLHYGWVHWALNAFGLLVLGRQVEALYGAVGLFGTFVGVSIASFASAAAFSTATLANPQVLIGASAGVMGLVGLLIAHSAVGFFRGRNRRLGRQLLLLGLVMLAQIVFDQVTPQISGRLHLTGVALGIGVGIPLAWRRWSLRTRSGADAARSGTPSARRGGDRCAGTLGRERVGPLP